MNLHIITGASKGLGAALAQFFAGRGDDVIDISRTAVKSHERIHPFPFDLASAESKTELIQNIFASFPADRYGMISLTNNAGLVDPVMHIADLQEPAIARSFAVNLTAPMALTAAFLKATEHCRGFRVITNISSGVAQDPMASWACYSAAKAGLRSFTQALAKDFTKNDQVKIINFSPGIIDTDMQSRIREVDKDDFPEVENFKQYKAQNKLRSSRSVAEALGAYVLKRDSKNFSEVDIRELAGT